MSRNELHGEDTVRETGETYENITSTKSGTKRALDVNIASEGAAASADSDNSTATPLTNGSIFLGPWTERTTPEILMAPSSDQDFAYYAQFATEQLSDALPYTAGTADGVDSSVPYTFDSTDFKSRIPRLLKIAREWYRIAIINTSGVDMTYLRFQTSIGQYGALASKLNAALLPDADAEVVRAIVTGQQPDGDYVNAPADGIATDVGGTSVETTAALGAGATYTSGWCDTDGFKSIELSIKADQLSATDGIMIEYTNDANTVTPTTELTKMFTFDQDSVDLGDLTIMVPPRLDGFRIQYTNGADAQGTFLLAATLRNAPVQSVELPISSPVNKNTNALITRTVAVGQTPDANFENTVQSGVFTGGSTTTPLLANAEFVGDWLDVSRFAQIFVFILSDQAYDDTAYTDSFGTTAGIVLDIRQADSGAADFTFDVPTLSNPPAHAFKQKPVLKWVRLRYTNGNTDQTTFNITMNAEVVPSTGAISLIGAGLSPTELALATSSAMFCEDQDSGLLRLLPVIPAGTEITNATRTVITKNVMVAEDSTGAYGRIERVGNAAKVYLEEIKPSVLINVRTNNGLDAFQISADATNAVQIPRPNIARIITPRKLTLTNLDSSVNIYYGYDDTVTTLTGDVILPGATRTLELGDDPTSDVASEVWIITGTLAGTAATDDLDADTVDSSTATSAGNQFASDDSRAVYDASGETSTISGFDATAAGVQANITSIKIKAEMRKEPSAGNETSAFVDTVGADAGNVTSITSPTVTANADHFYVISISRRDEFANITQINSTLGFTSFTLINETLSIGAGISAAESRTSTYYAVGTPTGNGTISATFSQTADHCVLSVTRFSNIDKTDPIGGSTRFGTNNTGNVYSSSVAGGVQGGQFYLAMGFEQGTHVSATTPSGATERFEDGSTIGNDQSQAVITNNVSTTASISFSGVLTGNADMTFVAVALNPEPAMDPVITLSHSEGATTLAQSLTSETDTTYTLDITADNASWTVAQIDAMTLTITASGVGAAQAEVDHVYLSTVSSSNVIRVPVSWLGDKP